MFEIGTIIPYLLFCVIMTGTPGPNNMMALASGVRVGFWPSMPLVLGISIGVGLQLIAIGLGFGALLAAYPALHNLLRYGGMAYLIYLAIKIARSGPISSSQYDKPLLGFVGGIAFQWINPKAWAITTSAVATYLPTNVYLLNIGLAAVAISAIATLCVSVWAASGTVLRRFLAHPLYANLFNMVAALVLVATTISIMGG